MTLPREQGIEFEVVVCHLDRHDFERLRPLLPGARFTVYDKSGRYPGDCVRIPNAGREGNAYLTHIIDNYGSLAGRTLFIQDDVLNHRPYILAFAEEAKSVSSDFHHFPCTWGGCGPVYRKTIVDGFCDLHTLGSPDAIKVACEELSLELPGSYTTETCAFLMLSRDKILSRGLDFYRRLRDWALGAENREFVLEHMWTLVFS